ncbi:MAG: methylated-DNA--[protein]-cysteine S-methyltransferase [Crocinitomicaceae bacterium]|nr:methylated-DNA--[protein]-cysteine S-methyltransferase [Crocinitomicaceae bacterium]
MLIETKIIDTPLGKLHAGATPNGICMLEYDDPKRIEKHTTAFKEHDLKENNSNSLITQLELQLSEYFDKTRKKFELPLEFVGTDFQCKVWNELLNIPFGSTRSYLEQSRAIGDINAIRAVANANGQNRISIVVPCHRVIGSDGSLTGYGGKLWRKKFLLELESNQGSLF